MVEYHALMAYGHVTWRSRNSGGWRCRRNFLHLQKNSC